MTYPELSEGAVEERHLGDTTPVPVGDRLGVRASSPHAHPLGQDLLQLGRRPTSNEGADEGEGVVIEVRLKYRDGRLYNKNNLQKTIPN